MLGVAGSSYYDESVKGFSHEASAPGIVPTTIPQYLKNHSASNSVAIHVKDGAWVNTVGIQIHAKKA
jgi:hypothetical protein